MGVFEEILKNKEELVLKFLDILQGNEASAKVDLSGVSFDVGKKMKIQLDGEITFTLMPRPKEHKK